MTGHAVTLPFSQFFSRDLTISRAFHRVETLADVVGIWLKLGGPGIFGDFLRTAYVEHTNRITSVARHPEFLMSVEPEIISSLERVFRMRGRQVRLAPGMSHFDLGGMVHPADAKTIAVLSQACEKLFGEAEQIDDTLAAKSFEGSFFCAGDAVSNSISRLAMQYEPIGVDPRLGLRRAREPVLLLDFETVCDSRFVEAEFGTTTERYGTQLIVEPNWVIKDTKKDNFFVPSFTVDQIEDYLLLSFVPNILDRTAYDNLDAVLVIGATHGVGTMAGSRFLLNRKCVELLERSVSDWNYWQALIKISHSMVSDFTPISDPQFTLIGFGPVKINETALQDWWSCVERGKRDILRKENEQRSFHPLSGTTTIGSDGEPRESVPKLEGAQGMNEDANKVRPAAPIPLDPTATRFGGFRKIVPKVSPGVKAAYEESRKAHDPTVGSDFKERLRRARRELSIRLK